MSHFSSVEVQFDQSCESELIQALEAQFGVGNVEVSDEGLDLFGFKGDNRNKKAVSSSDYAPKCNIVVRRQNVGAASNDVGYRRNENGKYTAYISEFDSGGNYNKKKQNNVAQEYAALVTMKTLTSKGYQVKREKQPDGTLKLTGGKWSQ